MSVFDYDENSINETETRNIEVTCTITVNNTPTKLKCTITGSYDNSIESMSIIYDDLGEWIREYYEDADCTIEKTSDEISEFDPLQTTLKSELDYLLALLRLADRLYIK